MAAPSASFPITVENRRASLLDRVNLTAGVGYADIEGYASRYSPRVSVAAYLRKPAPGALWSDTRITFNAGKEIKATSVTSVDRSLDKLLQQTPEGIALAERAGIGPIGPERGRNLDVGVEQGLWQGRARVRLAYFNNEFFDLVEFVSKNLLPQFGISPEVAAASGNGAYVNSQSFKAQGVEMSADALVGSRCRRVNRGDAAASGGLNERTARHEPQGIDHFGLPSTPSVVASMTVTGAPTCEGRTSLAVAVTVTCVSSGPSGSDTSSSTRAPLATNTGAVILS